MRCVRKIRPRPPRRPSAPRRRRSARPCTPLASFYPSPSCGPHRWRLTARSASASAIAASSGPAGENRRNRAAASAERPGCVLGCVCVRGWGVVSACNVKQGGQGGKRGGRARASGLSWPLALAAPPSRANTQPAPHFLLCPSPALPHHRALPPHPGRHPQPAGALQPKHIAQQGREAGLEKGAPPRVPVDQQAALDGRARLVHRPGGRVQDGQQAGEGVPGAGHIGVWVGGVCVGGRRAARVARAHVRSLRLSLQAE